MEDWPPRKRQREFHQESGNQKFTRRALLQGGACLAGAVAIQGMPVGSNGTCTEVSTAIRPRRRQNAISASVTVVHI